MRDYILLFVNGQQHRVTSADAFLTLSEFLRNRLAMCGTKIVCSEGDCGSCSVLCGHAGATNGATTGKPGNEFKYAPIDSCIRFVFQLDGCHIITVEGLARDGELNGIQKAMIDCHGSQCGFCTPGFVVAMTGILEENSQPTVEDWRHGLTGNLCRCTGYSPIIEAGCKSNPSNTPPISQSFPAATISQAMIAGCDDEIRIETDSADRTRTVYCPTTIQQATEFLAENPNAKIVAGATDLGVQFNKGFCKSNVWLDLNRISEMDGVTVEGDVIVAGARASWTELERFTKDLVPQFHEIVSVFGSPQIRNVGTIGGNIINASPIADSIPFLFVCEAELQLTSQSGARAVNINDFYQGYKKFDLRPGELLTSIKIPLPEKGAKLRLYKVSRRRDLDISTFTGAIKIECDGRQIKTAAIAFGAVGPVVLRLPQTEAFLVGRQLDLETMKLAGDIAVKEITPITDVRGGDQYRFQLARNVLLKYFHETCPEGALA
jgi:xanthine dehydrogenase small subunit